MSVIRLLTEHFSEFLSLKGGYTGSSVPTLVKLPHCLKSWLNIHVSSFSNAESNHEGLDGV